MPRDHATSSGATPNHVIPQNPGCPPPPTAALLTVYPARVPQANCRGGNPHEIRACCRCVTHRFCFECAIGDPWRLPIPSSAFAMLSGPTDDAEILLR